MCKIRCPDCSRSVVVRTEREVKEEQEQLKERWREGEGVSEGRMDWNREQIIWNTE